MVRDHFIVFDDEVVADTVAISATEFDRRIAAFDRITFGFFAPDAVVAGDFYKINVGMQHSSDGVHWTSPAGAPNAAWGWDDHPELSPQAWASTGFFTLPMLPLIRLAISLADVSRARLRVWVTLRDRGGGRPHHARILSGVEGGSGAA